MNNPSKLIVLRGPSGAGKSTVAQLLHERTTHKTALIEQDYYRHVMFNNPHSDIEAPRHVMFAGVLAALNHGYDVILEGIMSMGKYRPYFDDLLVRHPDNNHFFYFDVPFDESVRRRQARPKDDRLSDEKIREYYRRSGVSDYPGEIIIPGDSQVDRSVALIAARCALELIEP